MTRDELQARVIAERQAGVPFRKIADKMRELGWPDCTKNTVIGIIARHAPELQNSDFSQAASYALGSHASAA